jgi:plastocyanin
MKLKSLYLFVLVAALAVVFAGCAQDSTDTTSENPAMQEQVAKDKAGESTAAAGAESEKSTSGSSKLALAADPTGALKYDKTQLDASAGNVTIDFSNKSSVPHDVVVTGSGDKKLGATKEITDGSESLKLKDVKPGTYTFFCSVPGHEQAGMKGTLTVK